MLIVALDANALYGDPLMKSHPASVLLDLLKPGNLELHLSPVVLGELRRQHAERVADAAEVINTRLHKLGKDIGQATEALSGQVKALTAEIDSHILNRFAEVQASPAVQVQPWPELSIRDSVERELARRRPFVETQRGTIGQRDTAIWMGIVQLLRSHPEANVVFVTKDDGFLSGTGLHPHLVEDLEAQSIDAGRLRHVKTLHILVQELKDADVLAAGAGQEDYSQNLGLSVARTSALAAIQEFVSGWSGSDFGPSWNPRDGSLDQPTYDIGLPSQVSEVTLTAIEGPYDVGIPSDATPGKYVKCTFSVDVYISAFMDKLDWYSADYPDVELWDANWNDHYVNIEAERKLRVTARAYIGEEDEVSFVDRVTKIQILTT